MISGREKRQVETYDGRKMHPAIGGFEDGRVVEGKELR